MNNIIKIFLKIQFYFFLLFINCFANLLHIDESNINALQYVGNIFVENGQMQLNLLILEGLKKDNYVLEIGCGALVASIPVMSYLNKNHFVGIDPNKWLIDASLKIENNFKIVNEKEPIFLYNYDFDAGSLNIRFDYILSHSIMSHAAHWQLELFLMNCSKVLKENGKVIFSIRLTEPNEFGNPGAIEETKANEWQYPHNSFFHKETIIKEALKWFKKIEYKKEFTKLITSTDKSAFHDWFVATK